MEAYTFAFRLNEGEDEVWTAVGLDVPGVVTEAEGLEATRAAARDALQLHIDGLRECGRPVPSPRPAADLLRDPRLHEELVGAVLLPVAAPTPASRAVRIAITMDEILLARVDAVAKAQGDTRSGFLAEGARRLISAVTAA